MESWRFLQDKKDDTKPSCPDLPQIIVNVAWLKLVDWSSLATKGKGNDVFARFFELQVCVSLSEAIPKYATKHLMYFIETLTKY